MPPAVKICNQHHQVLRFWSEFRRERAADFPPVVLTLDHHTDVVCAYRDPAREIPPDAWRDEAAVEAAVAHLRHDEHFDWAVRSGLIAEAFVLSHVNATPCASDRLHVLCPASWPEENEQFADPEAFRVLADGVLESDFLRAAFGDVSRYGRYILDIDCDYFLTERALHPRDAAYFRAMARGAALVTFSLESDWVRLLRLPGETLSAAEIPPLAARLWE